eukprot:5298497-Heterocapsa_arctica.AAC.1
MAAVKPPSRPPSVSAPANVRFGSASAARPRASWSQGAEEALGAAAQQPGAFARTKQAELALRAA